MKEQDHVSAPMNIRAGFDAFCLNGSAMRGGRTCASVCSAVSQAHVSVRYTVFPNQVVSRCVPARAS
jgi:hypothetical protein